jgi:hypothetical protein
MKIAMRMLILTMVLAASSFAQGNFFGGPGTPPTVPLPPSIVG